jgi:hypothetical protein
MAVGLQTGFSSKELTMRSVITVLGLCLFSMPALASEPFSGSSRMRLELPKVETSTVSAQRYVMDPSQQLVASCPKDAKLIAAGCSADMRSLEGSFLTDDLAIVPVLTKTTISTQDQVSSASCNAVSVRPDQFVRLAVSVECSPIEPIAYSKN